jgi:hypothetical protein
LDLNRFDRPLPRSRIFTGRFPKTEICPTRDPLHSPAHQKQGRRERGKRRRERNRCAAGDIKKIRKKRYMQICRNEYLTNAIAFAPVPPNHLYYKFHKEYLTSQWGMMCKVFKSKSCLDVPGDKKWKETKKKKKKKKKRKRKRKRKRIGRTALVPATDPADQLTGFVRVELNEGDQEN